MDQKRITVKEMIEHLKCMPEDAVVCSFCLETGYTFAGSPILEPLRNYPEEWGGYTSGLYNGEARRKDGGEKINAVVIY